MLCALAAVLFVAWMAGLLMSYTLGGLIHLLPIAAILMVAVRIIGKGTL